MKGKDDPVCHVTAELWPEVVAWLDRGLRRDIQGRLEAEYPISLRPENASSQILICDDGRPLSHSMYQHLAARIGDLRLRVGLIGLVYTEEDARGRGLAGRCVQACVEELRSEGAALAILWSDRHAFYERLGFHPAGRERFLTLDIEVLERASAGGKSAIQVDVGIPEARDWPAIEELYDARSFRAERRAGDLVRLAAAPDVDFRVARRAGRPVAYAALGRGDDFAEVVHEWAGEQAGVFECLAALLRGRCAVGLMTGPEDGALVARLRAAGAAQHQGIFGLVRLLDPRRLWKSVRSDVPELEGVEMASTTGGVRIAGSEGAVEITEREALALLLDGAIRPDLCALAPALSRQERDGLEKRRSLSLYLWGFDSI
ncbi:MAG: GNAT family N-acetyltransferase [bacterium]|nr:GNAT family N-acetyltransferase [bacterium]